MQLRQVLSLATVGAIGLPLSLIGTHASFANHLAPSSNAGNSTIYISKRPTNTRNTSNRQRRERFSFVCNDTTVALKIQRPQATRQLQFIRFSNDSYYFGGNYSPENRCNMVASRLNQQVLSGNQLKPGGVWLGVGVMNRETVIFSSTGYDKRLLLTLKPDNARQAGVVLWNMAEWLSNRSFASGGAAVFESEGGETEKVDLEKTIAEGIKSLESKDPEFAKAGLESETDDQQVAPTDSQNPDLDNNDNEQSPEEGNQF